MAIKRMIIDGYGQLELNNVFFRRTGAIEAQCFLDEQDFANIPAENGMLLAVDRVNRKLLMPKDGLDLPVALNYTTEHMYDERHIALKDFCKKRGEDLPRMGYPSVGELWTTNCLSYDDGEYADEDAVKAAVKDKTTLSADPVYGVPCENGTVKLTATKATKGLCLKAVEKTTMPDGQFAIKFQVVMA